MAEHVLECWPNAFDAIADGRKRFTDQKPFVGSAGKCVTTFAGSQRRDASRALRKLNALAGLLRTELGASEADK